MSRFFCSLGNSCYPHSLWWPTKKWGEIKFVSSFLSTLDSQWIWLHHQCCGASPRCWSHH